MPYSYRHKNNIPAKVGQKKYICLIPVTFKK